MKLSELLESINSVWYRNLQKNLSCARPLKWFILILMGEIFFSYNWILAFKLLAKLAILYLGLSTLHRESYHTL